MVFGFVDMPLCILVLCPVALSEVDVLGGKKVFSHAEELAAQGDRKHARKPIRVSESARIR